MSVTFFQSWMTEASPSMWPRSSVMAACASEASGGRFIRAPKAEQLKTMQSLVEQAMKDGAVGLSTGLIYVPGSFAKTDEIVALAKVAAAHGGIYASHMRFETAKIFGADG